MSITLGSVGSGYNLTVMNSNFDLIQDFLNDVAIKREVDSEAEANEMRTFLDMNNNRIVNCVYAVNNHEPVTLGQLGDIESGIHIPGINVSLDPSGTRFVSTNVQTWLVEMDDVLDDFIRIETGEEGIDPNPPNGTPIQPYEIWLVNSLEGVKSRPLPAAPTDGVEVTIRDHQGNTSTNTAFVLRSGKTIMGLEEDLTITVDWSWVRLKYYLSDDDWKVIGGGVGGQVLFLPEDIFESMFQIGHVLITKNANNPNSYYGWGTWVRGSVGTVLAGIGLSTDINGVSKTIVTGINPGEWDHPQTEEEIAAHGHVYVTDDNIDVKAAEYGVTLVDGTTNSEGSDGGGSAFAWETAESGESVPMNVTNPITGYYVWERTA